MRLGFDCVLPTGTFLQDSSVMDLMAIVRGAAGGGGGGTAARSRADRQVLTAARLLASVGPGQSCGVVVVVR